MVTPTFVLLAINYKKKKCSIFDNLRDTAHPKSSTFAKQLTIFYVFVSPIVLKIEHYFLFAIDR